MNIGDLVPVTPAKDNVYIVVGSRPDDDDEYLGRCWMLYNENIGVQRMHEKWIEVVK